MSTVGSSGDAATISGGAGTRQQPNDRKRTKVGGGPGCRLPYMYSAAKITACEAGASAQCAGHTVWVAVSNSSC